MAHTKTSINGLRIKNVHPIRPNSSISLITVVVFLLLEVIAYFFSKALKISSVYLEEILNASLGFSIVVVTTAKS